jgi:hypothetical protein
VQQVISWIHAWLDDFSAFCGGGYNALVLVVLASTLIAVIGWHPHLRWFLLSLRRLVIHLGSWRTIGGKGRSKTIQPERVIEEVKHEAKPVSTTMRGQPIVSDNRLSIVDQMEVDQAKHEGRIQKALRGEPVSPPLTIMEDFEAEHRKHELRMQEAISGRLVDPPLNVMEEIELEQRRRVSRINKALKGDG